MKIPTAFSIATAALSRQVDDETVNNFGIDGFTLMEVAGSSAAKALLQELEQNTHGVFLCGKGNNGGDALVVARYLAQHDYKITVVFAGGTDDLSPPAEKNYQLLQKIAKNDTEAKIKFIAKWDEFDLSSQPDFIIDGMLGTGLDSDLRGSFTDAVQWANNGSCTVIAMDIPTGLHADTGEIMGNAVHADQTFAFGMLKQGFYLGEGKSLTGQIRFCELPFPRYLFRASSTSTYLIDHSWISDQSREPARHKYEAGVVHIVAGSEGLTGAAILAAKSAWAEGVGAVILVCPRGVLQVFENNLPQIIKKPVGSREDVHFKEEHLDEVSEIVNEKAGPALVGPGIGRKESTKNFVINFLSNTQKNIILDADGLWALAQNKQWQKPENTSWILTPHPGELSTLLNKEIESDHQRLRDVKKTARQQDMTLLSKGYPVILATPGGDTFLSEYDTRVFSRAGFGDVLAGKIAAFSAMNYPPAESCIRALLDGQKKATALQDQNQTPEPLTVL